MSTPPPPTLSAKENWERVYRDLARYQDLYLYQQQLVELICEKIPALRDARILEVGCGKGNEIVQLAKRGGACLGLDFSESAMAWMQTRLAKEGMRMPLIRGDARRLPFKIASFDLVFSQGVLEHFANPGDVLQEQRHVMRNGGIIVIEVPNKWNVYTIYKKILLAMNRWPPGWETEYSPRELKVLLRQNGFEVLDCVGWDFFIVKIFRKLRKILGLKDKLESPFARSLRRRLQRNPILLNFFLSLTIVARKKDGGEHNANFRTYSRHTRVH